MKEEKNIGCVVIDYLRFIHPNNLIPMISHTRFEIKHYFYQLANELNIKIFIQFYPNQKKMKKIDKKQFTKFMKKDLIY